MHKPQQQVRDLHVAIGHPTSPALPEIRMGQLRAKLILEEAIETVVALVGGDEAYRMVNDAADAAGRALVGPASEPNLVEAIDGLCDTIVVCYGTAEAIGIDLEPFFDEVHRSNMAKKGGPVREDGKRGKPPGWTPPDIAGVLVRVTKGDERGAEPLSCDCYGGCWGDHSKDWPKVLIGDERLARAIHAACWSHLKLPYGSYVSAKGEIRLLTEEYKQQVLKFIADRLTEVGL